MIRAKCTNYRKADDIAREFLTREYDREIVILRIIDNSNDNFVIPRIYRKHINIKSLDIVTKPEIEILHIISEGLEKEFEQEKKHTKSKLNPSSFCKGAFLKKYSSIRSVKSEDCIKCLYGDDICKLTVAIKKYHSSVHHKAYCLYDLLA